MVTRVVPSASVTVPHTPPSPYTSYVIREYPPFSRERVTVWVSLEEEKSCRVLTAAPASSKSCQDASLYQ